MKKQTITIEREVPDDATDEDARLYLVNLLNASFAMDVDDHVSVVSEPIPEPIVLKVLGLVANPRAVRDVCEEALMDNYRTRSFHAEVIPQ